MPTRCLGLGAEGGALGFLGSGVWRSGVLVAVLVTTSCAVNPRGPEGIAIRPPVRPPSSLVVEDAARLAAARRALVAGEAGAMESLVREAVNSDPGGDLHIPLILGDVRGRERAFFEVLLGFAVHEARDVSRWLEAAARAVGRIGPLESRLAVVREVSGRECCMRRGFMAAALRGLASGMVESGEAPEVQAEAVLRLGELVSQTDAELSSAAQAALRQFRLPPGLRR